jgi:acetyl-CoA carboxylase carboxyl transferase subunit alpha
MHKFCLVDEIIKEPLGGAHTDPVSTAKKLKKTILETLEELSKMDPDDRIAQRIEKFSQMGVVVENG